MRTARDVYFTREKIESFKGTLTDVEIIGDARQPGDDWLDKYDIYSWYHAIGAVHNPTSILEMGVRYGYALSRY
jgi:hypothetical protein